MTKQNHDHIVDPTEKVQPAPAPLPESVESALCVVSLSEYPSVESVLRFHISDLTRRLADAEAERDNAAYLLMRAAPLTIKANARAEAAERELEELKRSTK